MSLSTVDYRPRDVEHGVLYRVIDEHLDAFLDAATHHADGSCLPKFVEQEFRDFLTCGVLRLGFARLRCSDCAFERLVPFSCKGRGFCPSCGGRRMTECAARRRRAAPRTRTSPGSISPRMSPGRLPTARARDRSVALCSPPPPPAGPTATPGR